MLNDKRRFNITSKIVLGNLFVVLFLSVCVIAVSVRITSLQKEMNNFTHHDILVHDTANQMQKSEFDMETGQRGYIITGDDSYLDMYSKGNIQWVENYNKLHELISDNPKQISNLEQLKSIIDSWTINVGDHTILLKKQKKTDELRQFFIADPGKKYIDQMRNQFDSFLSAEKQLTDSRAANMDQKNNLLKALLYIVLVLISIISITIALFISNAIVRTLKQVVKSISEIGSDKGDYSQRIEIKTRDEIGDLARTTNGLLENLEKYTWLQSKIAEVASMYQGVTNLEALPQAFIDRVSTLIHASYSVVYVRDDND